MVTNKEKLIEKMSIRDHEIRLIDKKLFGEDYQQRVNNLVELAKTEPNRAIKELIEWLGKSHPMTVRIQEEIQERRKTNGLKDPVVFCFLHGGLPPMYLPNRPDFGNIREIKVFSEGLDMDMPYVAFAAWHEDKKCAVVWEYIGWRREGEEWEVTLFNTERVQSSDMTGGAWYSPNHMFINFSKLTSPTLARAWVEAGIIANKNR